MKNSVYFRATDDTNADSKHMMRILALADMVKEKFETVFITRSTDEAILSTFRKYFNNIITIPEFDSYNEEARFLISEGHVQEEQIVVLDGPEFSIFYQEIMRKAGCKIVCVDDKHNSYFVADVVLNHVGDIKSIDYYSSPYTQFALGTDFAMLRPEFFNKYASKNGVTSTFVSLGKSTEKQLLEVLKILAVKKLTNKINIVINDGCADIEQFEKFIKQNNITAVLHKNPAAEEVGAMMGVSDIAVCDADLTAYEYAAIRGGLFLIQPSEDQKEMYDHFLKEGLAEKFENIDKSVNLERLMENQQRLLDSESPDRLLKIIEELDSVSSVKLRKANFGDLQQFFDWANKPEARLASNQKDPVTIAAHSKWYEEKMKEVGAYLYVLSDGKYDIGQIRFDIKQSEAVINYSIDKRFRGRGLGTTILKLGIEKFCQDHQGAEPIVGFVNQSNELSNKCFRKFRFEQDETVIPGSYKYILKR